MGLDTSILQFHDVMSTEDWALEMIPRPVVGVLMLYPIKDTTEEHRREEDNKIKESGQTLSNEVYYMKQTVGNACGTVGTEDCTIYFYTVECCKFFGGYSTPTTTNPYTTALIPDITFTRES
jgi:hypothetical protein